MEALRRRQRVPGLFVPGQINQSVIYITDILDFLYYTTPNIIRFRMKGELWLLPLIQKLQLSH